MGDSVSFNSFVEQIYAEIPEKTFNIEDKEKAVEAKKKILKHPGCPESSKLAIMKEIATIEGEIAAMRDEAKNQSMNSSIFPPRNNLG